MHRTENALNKIRVTFHQPSLASYRLALFQRLSSHPEIALKLVYGDRSGIKNANPTGLDAEESHLTRFKVLRIPLYWHWPQVSRAHKKHSDVLVLPWNIQYLTLIPAIIRARVSGVRVILWGHGVSKKESKLRRSLRYSITRLAHAVIFYTETAASNAIKNRFIPQQKAFAAPNAIDESEIYKFRSRKEGVTHNPEKEILFVSRLHPDNRLDLLIKALPAIIDRHRDAKVTIIGKGEQERNRLARLADDLGVTKNINFVGAIYDEEKLAMFFNRACVFCYPENIGLSLLHAIHYGIPAVTSENAKKQNPEFSNFENGKTGLTYSENSIDDLAGKICSLFEDSIKRYQIEQENLSLSKRLTIDAMVNGMIEAIKNDLR